MAKTIRDTDSTVLSGAKKKKAKATAEATKKQAPDKVTVTLANAPIYQAVYTERLYIELKKFNVMFGDVVKLLREQHENG